MEGRCEDVETSPFPSCSVGRFSGSCNRRSVSNLAVVWYMLRRQGGRSAIISSKVLMPI